jgi:hypothetical protein
MSFHGPGCISVAGANRSLFLLPRAQKSKVMVAMLGWIRVFLTAFNLTWCLNGVAADVWAWTRTASVRWHETMASQRATTTAGRGGGEKR